MKTLPPLLDLRAALATARSLFRDRVPAAILDAEPVVFVTHNQFGFGNPVEIVVPAAGSLQSADAFAPEFDELMLRGYPWVNFHIAGVHEGQLVVLIETPDYTVPGPPGTSLNFSGPSNAVMENHGVVNVRVLAAG